MEWKWNKIFFTCACIFMWWRIWRTFSFKYTANLLNNVIEARALTGSNIGERILIPRIPLSTTEKYPFNFTRRQFPIRLAFAITANKSQGQTLKKVTKSDNKLSIYSLITGHIVPGWSLHAKAFLCPWSAVCCMLESHRPWGTQDTHWKSRWQGELSCRHHK